MALAGNKLSGRLALLALKLRLLTLDPCQLGNGKEAYSLIIDSQWCGYPYPTGRWIPRDIHVGATPPTMKTSFSEEISPC